MPRTKVRHRRRSRLAIDTLEVRLAPATDVLSFHGDLASTGVINTETELTPANVDVNSFGKLKSITLDGQAYAQPLIKTGVNIVDGPNTTSGVAGTYDVVFVATQHNSLYAIDAGTSGQILWHRNFLDVNVPQNNTLGATAISTLTAGDVGSQDITPEIGITGTPVIDPVTGTLYVVAKTKETIGGVPHFVQRLHAINITNGTDRAAPYLLGDTYNGNVNNTSIYVYGTGDGNVVDPYHGTGKKVVQFNALREHQRAGLSLVNNQVYIAWASHGDNGPYHGWVVALDVSQLTTSGFNLKGVFNTSPNDGLSGIWQGAGKLAFESDGSAFYFETGNGSGGAPTLNAAGFPVDGNYNNAVVKVVADPATTPTSQNINGWGLKAVDYFIPYNVVALDGADSDFGSGSPILLPDSAGIPGHPKLMIVGGKEGKLYVIDRNDLGHFHVNNDDVLNSVPDGSGHNTPPNVMNGLLSTPSWFNNKLYALSGYNGSAYAFTLGSDGKLTTVSETANDSFGYLPGSPIVSANGTSNGVVWIMDRQANRVHAYDAATLATELWHSGQSAGGVDNVGAVTKFAPPAVANGKVYVGTMTDLVIYGEVQPPTSVPNAPVLSASALSGSAIRLTWTDSTLAPNKPTSYSIEKSLDGTNFTPATTAPAGATSLAIGGLQPLTHYWFRIRGNNSFGSSANSNIADATTTNQTQQINFANGFTNATGLTHNGSSAISGSRLRLTNGGNQRGSTFFNDALDITGFSTQFTFQLTNPQADGFTFTVQGNGPTALGATGGSLGYGGITNSVAIKFDIYDNNGEGINSTGLYTGGAEPFQIGSIDLASTGIDLHSGHVFRADIVFDGEVVTVTITDTQTNQSATQSYTVDVPAMIGDNVAYVGFTGATGGLTATQEILSWTFASTAASSPHAPTGLGAVPASATSVRLSWTDNATNETGYHVDRATDAGFTQNLITLTLQGKQNSYTDTASGLAPSGTYYYRIRAFNSAGDSDHSNVASVTIPVAPPMPTNQKIDDVTSTQIDISWQDNAGHAADGYKILRSINHGSFELMATLPPTSRTPPSIYEWSDENLTPGTFYEYHILAYNVSGNNDFAGVNATTITETPVVTAAPGSGVVTLNWEALTGAAKYDVYRGTSPGGQGATPIATVTAAGYEDTSVTIGTTYYYTVIAINANADHVPALPAASEASAEVSATPTLFPGAPTGVIAASADNVQLPQVAIDWVSTPGATSYKVYRGLSGNAQSATPIATGIVGTSFVDKAVVRGTTYFYKVAAVNAHGEGPRSAEARATPHFAAQIDFTSASGEAVPGYVKDIGQFYGSRLNGMMYGWTRNGTAYGVDRDDPTSPDELRDSFHNLQPYPGGGSAQWLIAVPAGTYSIHIVIGDPASTQGKYYVNVGSMSTGGIAAVRGEPSAANRWVENTVTVTTTTGLLWVRNAIGAIGNRIASIDIRQVFPFLNRPNGFAGMTALQVNGSARVVGSALRLTGAAINQAGSAFTTVRAGVTTFTTSFDFRLTNASADGFAFVLQGVGPGQRGTTGGGLGYAGINKSVAVKFDLYSNNGEGANSTGLYINGAQPTGAGSIDLGGTGIDFHSGHTFRVTMTYDGARLRVTILDTATNATATQSYAVDIVGIVGGRTAYIGFTGATGGDTAIQEILNWKYSPAY